MDNKPRLVVLGLDSLPPGLTKTLAETGVMPFINELMEKGSFGALESVVPAHTGSGWNSAWTGQPPVRHGYFGFYYYDQEDDIMRLCTSDHLSLPTIWQMLNTHRLRAIVINSPMQYPATKLDGIMVSGFMAPSFNKSSVYPPSFYEKMASDIPDYVFDVPWEKHQTDDDTFEKNIASVIKVFNQRVKVARLAAESGSWDVLMVVFKSIDNMLHYTWNYVQEDSPSTKRRELSLKAFKVLDAACRELSMMAGYPDVNVLVFSDHGHGPIKHNLYVNRLLAQWGYLVPKSKFSRRLDKYIASINKRFKTGKIHKKPHSHVGTRLRIQWNKSKAAMVHHGVIYLNVKGRQPEGIVTPEEYQSVREDISARLMSLKTGNNGTPLIQKIECPQEASPLPPRAGETVVADFLFEPSDGILLRNTVAKCKGPAFKPYTEGNRQGCHRLDGIVLGSGPAFGNGAEIEGNLYDIAPTIMAVCGLPIPRGLVGRPIASLLNPEINIEYDTKEATPSVSARSAEESFSVDEERIVRDRLENLGYLD